MMKNRLPRLLAGPLLACLLLPCFLYPAHAYAGVLSGVVLHGQNGQSVRGATVQVEGSDASATSDLDGLVSLRLEPGTYTLVVEKDGFEPKQVAGVEVAAGGGNFAVVLDPLGGTGTTSVSEEITVEAAAADVSTEEALLSARKNAAQISDSIGSEEMSKNTGSDAAGALQRVTGVSLQDGKYAYVRGLGGRYSSTALNGSKIPSTEFEEKVVPLDLFPSGMIEKITVSKSYTVDKPGDFAAGVIDLATVQFPSRRNASLSLGGDWNGETTGDDYLEAAGGLDFFGGGGQGFPDAIPDETLVRQSPFDDDGFTPEELEEIGEAVGGVWSPTREDDAPFAYDFKGSYGNSTDRLGFVLSASYESGVQNRDEVQNIFRVSGDGVKPLHSYTFDFTDEKVRQALTGNLAYRAGENHHVTFRSLLTNISTAESRLQEGFNSDLSTDIENTRISFLEQEVWNAQLGGDHYWDGLGDGGLLEWHASYSQATTDEDRREVLYLEDSRGELVLTDRGQSGFLFTNDLEDTIEDVSADWTSYFHGGSIPGGKVFGSIRGGVATTRNERFFDARRVRFDQRRTFGVDLSLPPEELYTDENIGPVFELEEITRPTDTYAGDHEILAGYLQADLAWGEWRLIGGARVEDSQQVVTTLSRATGNPEIESEVADTDVLPSFNLVYKLGDDSNLRFAGSRTVNRPELRELAPFSFTHVSGGFTATGNPDLERSLITSFDVRWEWFPEAAEVVAVSVFLKDFDQPIEKVLLGGSLFTESWVNAESAENFGVELEMRRNLGSLIEGLEELTAIVNYAWVDSEVTLDRGQSVVTNETRALVGQPDNVLNAILEWDHPSSGTILRLLYNFTDDKVAAAGGFGLPDVILNARNTVDVVWGQDIGRDVSLKLSASNLTDEAWLWTQGDGVFREYETGASVGLSFTYRPFE